MEIADYLKVARRRLWILVLVPVLAAGAALTYGLLSPRTYSATATVLTPSLVGAQYSQFTGPQAIDQFVSAFAASAADPTVIAQTATETGASSEDLTDNVSVAQVGASSNVTLTYSGEDQKTSSEVAHALATNALVNIYSAQGKIAGLQADAAKKGVDAANKAVNDYVTKVGVGEPSAAYTAAISQVTWLQQTQATYAASGDKSAASLIRGSIASAQKQAQTIGATLPQYNTLVNAQTLANEAYQSALGDQRKVQVQAAAAADPEVITTTDAEPDRTGASTVKLVVPVAGAAVLFAIIVIALFEFIAAVRRQQSGRELEGKHVATDTVPAEPAAHDTAEAPAEVVTAEEESADEVAPASAPDAVPATAEEDRPDAGSQEPASSTAPPTHPRPARTSKKARRAAARAAARERANEEQEPEHEASTERTPSMVDA
ncbi:Wzz/FepE/Etk N-terminal domain-containing protein [Phycicoccus avicenniae]|uniref:Wzz/FepE/Etk N-terminal domain-containing protein n=1 Tax=Phycicoccus avicenniae TaxID=2828860 RepID=UPI003D2D7B4B